MDGRRSFHSHSRIDTDLLKVSREQWWSVALQTLVTVLEVNYAVVLRLDEDSGRC